MYSPYFDSSAPEAANLGGLGTVIGHETGHAFDSNCIKYDQDGNYNPEWLSESDRKILTERAEISKGYYSDYTILDVYHVDGELTNGENYADLGGMEAAVSFFEDKNDLKIFFENYARTWSSLENDSDAIKMLRYDEHSPNIVRVNAVVSSCNKFYKTYDVKETDGMYISPEERVTRW